MQNSKNGRNSFVGRAKPNLTPDVTPTQASALASVFGGFATWGKPEPARISCQTEAPRTGAKIRGEGGVIAV